jgi:hypothetical protein
MKKELLQTVFWDVKVEDLDTLNDTQIISRSLSYGTVPLLQAVFTNYGREKIQLVFRSMKKKSMPSKRYSYFEFILQ